MVGTWLGEIRSCSSLAVLLDSAWVLLNKIYQPFFTSLYKRFTISLVKFPFKFANKIGKITGKKPVNHW